MKRPLMMSLLLLTTTAPIVAAQTTDEEITAIKEQGYSAAWRMSLRIVMDSLDLWIASLPKNQPTPSLYSPDSMRALRTDENLDSVWRKFAGSAADSVRFIAITSPRFGIVDGEYFRAGAFDGAILTPDGKTCVLVSMRSWVWSHHLRPCAMLARFGRPGTAMRKWLTELNFVPLNATEWIDDPAGRKIAAGAWISERHWRDDNRNSWLMVARFLFNRDRPPYQLGASGLSCISGRRDSCSDVFDWVPQDWFGRDPRTPSNAFPSWMVWGYTHLFSPDRFVADLIHQRGEEKFRVLWTAPDSDFDAAFRRVYSQSVDEAVALWLNERYSPAPSTWDLALGTEIPWRGTLVSLAWLFPFGLLAGVTARSRQMGR
jgi:hypothetical protein